MDSPAPVHDDRAARSHHRALDRAGRARRAARPGDRRRPTARRSTPRASSTSPPGGLRIVDTDPAHFAYVVAPTGQFVPACAAGGLSCLVPRLANPRARATAHGSAELASTLSGGIELESRPRPSAAPAVLGALALGALCLCSVLAVVWAAVALSRRAARTAMGRVRIAARRALRASRGRRDPRRCEGPDPRPRGSRPAPRRPARAPARESWRASTSERSNAVPTPAREPTVPAAAAALAWLSAERAAAAQLEADHGSVLVELERIESVLRTAALRVGGGREAPRYRTPGACAVVPRSPIPSTPSVAELDLRDEAIRRGRRFLSTGEAIARPAPPERRGAEWKRRGRSATRRIMPPARVRFAPSPTGYLHIGGVRTALFNWLWARKTKGSFILRIEDTDQERSTRESVGVILDSLRWLGLDWDEGPEVGGAHGPYTQMERLAVYQRVRRDAHRGRQGVPLLLHQGGARRAARRAQGARSEGQFRYPGTCRHRTDEPDLPFVVRFHVPETGSVRYVDKVFGEVSRRTPRSKTSCLLRSDGVPLYNFGAVVDDASMGVTLVARGRDHMVNTPPQIMIYEALGRPAPDFAHLPMMLAPNGEKLSKRHGAVSVTEYRDQGYSPNAVLNYLARFGWSHGDQEVFSRGELVDAFDWEHCNRSDGKFDAKKFLAIDHEHLKTRAPHGRRGVRGARHRRSSPRAASRRRRRASSRSSRSSASARPRSSTRPIDSTSCFAIRPPSTRRPPRSFSCPRARRCFAASPRRSRGSSRGRRRLWRPRSTRGFRARACR